MSAKSKDTTKTAHVMNLLRKNAGGAQATESAPPVQELAVEQPETVSAQTVQSPSVQHPIIASLNEEAAISLEIKDALEQELRNGEVRQENVQIPETDMEEKREFDYNQAELLFSESPEEEMWAASKEIAEESAEEPVLAEIFANSKAVEPVPVEETEESARPQPAMEVYNVMQTMVEENVEKYMKMFELCDCPRCRADVRALALNQLQPKYVVMGPGEYIPRITVYERQFSAVVTAQILRACKIVAESPRHGEFH